MFSKKERSTFPYWFAHWCAFQMTALNLGVWKFKYLFHDFEKPWLRLFFPYKFVQKWHREHSKHHLIWFFKKNKNRKKECKFKDADWQAMIIDWECSRFTKSEAQLNAVEEFERQFNEINKFLTTHNRTDDTTCKWIEKNIENTEEVYCKFKYAYQKIISNFNELEF